MNITHTNIIQITFLVLIAMAVNLQFTSAQSYNHEIEHISIQEGLSQSSVSDILQDNTGFLWIATEDGLNKYDGYTFKSFNTKSNNSTTLSNNSIKSLVLDRNDCLWIGTQIGLSWFDTRKNVFQRFLKDTTQENYLHNNVVNELKLKDNQLWLATDQGISHVSDINNPIFESITAISGKGRLGVVNGITIDNNGFIWMATYNQGICVLDPNSKKVYPIIYSVDEIFEAEIKCIAFFGNKIWVGAKTGILSLDIDHLNLPGLLASDAQTIVIDKSSKFISSVPTYPIRNGVLSIMEDSEGIIWIGTQRDGVFRLKQNNDYLEPYLTGYDQHPDAFRTTPVKEIFEDYAKSIWIGTQETGLYKIRRSDKKFGLLRAIPADPNSLSSNRIRGLMELDDHLWVATGDGLNRYNRRTQVCRIYQNNPQISYSLSNNDVKTMCSDHTGSIWVATNDGLNKLDPKTSKFIRFYAGDINDGALLTNNKIRTVSQLNDGYIWVGTLGGGISVIDPIENKLIDHFMHDPDDTLSLSDNNVMHILQTQDNRIWISTYGGGLNLMLPNSLGFKKFREGKNFIFSRLLTTIQEDTDGSLWIGSYGDGLCHFYPNDGQYDVYTEQNGLSNNVVYVALPYDDEVWVSTNLGINRYSKVMNKFTRYNEFDGLQSNEFNSGSFLKSSSGELFFGGVEGLTFFHPDSIVDNDLPAKIAFTDFRIFNQSVEPGELILTDQAPLDQVISDSARIRLSYKHNVFTIQFAALDFTSPYDNQFSHQLLGFDPDWVDVNGNQRSVTYTNLAPGNYTFMVKAANNDGIWNETPAVLFITIKPALWQQLWFRVLAGICLLAFGTHLVKRRINKAERGRRYLESRVKKHTKEISEQKKIVEKQNEILRQSEGNLRNINRKKDQIFYILAHHVRSPLTTLLSMLDLLEEKDNALTTNEILSFSKTIKQEAGDSLLLLDNTLYWSMLQFDEISLIIHSLNLKRIIHRNIEKYERKAKQKRINIKFDCDESQSIQGDEKIIEIILQNLISNALKYSYEDSSINLKLVRDGQKIIFTIENYGVSIDEKAISFLFDEHHNVATEGTHKEKGTGIGLVVCQKLAEKMGYLIHADVTDANSTRFIVEIPVND